MSEPTISTAEYAARRAADASMLTCIIWHTVKGVDAAYPGDKSVVMRGVLARH